MLVAQGLLCDRTLKNPHHDNFDQRQNVSIPLGRRAEGAVWRRGTISAEAPGTQAKLQAEARLAAKTVVCMTRLNTGPNFTRLTDASTQFVLAAGSVDVLRAKLWERGRPHLIAGGVAKRARPTCE